MVFTPFFTASLFREFAGNVTTTMTTNFAAIPAPLPDITGTLSSSRVGTYAQLGFGTAFHVLDTGWLGYARTDFRTGGNIEGLSVNAGLRYQFNPEQTGAANLKGDPAPAPAAWQGWGGSYAGVFAGRIQGEEQWRSVPFGTTVDPEFAGYLAGGQVGYNYQLGRIVVGIESDFAFSNAEGGKSCPNAFFYTCAAEAKRLGSLTLRLGQSWDRSLIYAKGGWAFG